MQNGGSPVWEETAITLTHQWTVGGADQVYFDAPLHRVRDVAVSEEGGVYVSDGGNARILQFTEEATPVQAIGTEGAGPGEFQGLNDVELRGDTLFALDGKQRRVSLFGSDGSYIRNIEIRERAAGLGILDSLLLIPHFSFSTEDPLVAAYTLQGMSIEGFVAPLESTRSVTLAGEAGDVATSSPSFFFAFAYPFRIEEWRRGKRIRIITLEDERFAPPTAARTEGEYTYGGRLPAKIRGIGVLGDDRMLVQVSYSESAPMLYLFSEDGRFLSRTALPEGHQLGTVAGTEVYTYIHGGGEAPARVTRWKLSL